MKRNRYPGRCVVCGQQAEADLGYLTSDGLRHMHCMRPRRQTYRENLADKIDRERDLAEVRALSRRAEAVSRTIAILFLLPGAARCDPPQQH